MPPIPTWSTCLTLINVEEYLRGKLITVYTKIFFFFYFGDIFIFQNADISLIVAGVLSRLLFYLYSELRKTFSALHALFRNYRKLRVGTLANIMS